jgi:RNA polymerase sigma-70 factor (ECF subfamily)
MELVQQLREGRPQAVENLYTAYTERLYSLVYNRVGRDQQATEDIVQETFLAAIKSSHKFRGQSKLYTWLCSIAYHKISDYYRSQRRQNGNQSPTQNVRIEDMEQLQGTDPPIPGLIESEESRLITEQAMYSLPLDYQSVLTFKYIEDMSVKEIGQVMGKTEKSIEGLLKRARQELREKLGTQVRDSIG